MTAQDNQLILMLKALSEENRLTLLRLLNQHEYSFGELASSMNLSEPTVSHHLSRLRQAGLVSLRTAGTQRFYKLNQNGLARFKQLAAEIEQMPDQPDSIPADEAWIDALDWPEEERKVLRDHTLGGKLLRIPGKYKKWLVVIRWLATLFMPDVLYSEKEVNAIISTVHAEDFASLRRGLVDMGYLRRERGGGKYWLAKDDDKPLSVNG